MFNPGHQALVTRKTRKISQKLQTAPGAHNAASPSTGHVMSSITWPFNLPLPFPICVHWNWASISNRFWDIPPQHMLTNTTYHN